MQKNPHVSKILKIKLHIDENFFATLCSTNQLIVWSLHRARDKFVLKPLKRINFLRVHETSLKFNSHFPLISGMTIEGSLFLLNYLNKKLFALTVVPFNDKILSLCFLENPFGFFVYWNAANEIGCISQDGTLLSRMSSSDKFRKPVFWKSRKGFYKAGIMWENNKFVSVYSLPFFQQKQKLKSWFEVRRALADPRHCRVLLTGQTSLNLLIFE